MTRIGGHMTRLGVLIPSSVGGHMTRVGVLSTSSVGGHMTRVGVLGPSSWGHMTRFSFSSTSKLREHNSGNKKHCRGNRPGALSFPCMYALSLICHCHDNGYSKYLSLLRERLPWRTGRDECDGGLVTSALSDSLCYHSIVLTASWFSAAHSPPIAAESPAPPVCIKSHTRTGFNLSPLYASSTPLTHSPGCINQPTEAERRQASVMALFACALFPLLLVVSENA